MCIRDSSWVSQPVCKRCGKELPVDTAEYCLDCTRHPRSFEGGRALLNYNRTASRSMAQIKYNNRREYLDFYAEAMARRLGPAIRRMNAQALVPVPVHPSRMKVRGFNQAAVSYTHLPLANAFLLSNTIIIIGNDAYCKGCHPKPEM